MPALRRLGHSRRVLLGGLAARPRPRSCSLWQSHLTFFIDDWDLLLQPPRVQRATPSSTRTPSTSSSGRPSIYKAIQATVGMEQLLPYALVSDRGLHRQRVLLFVVPASRGSAAGSRWPPSLPILFIGVGLRGPADAVPDRLLRLDGLRDRRPARARAQETAGGDAWACAAPGRSSLTFAELAIPFVTRGRRRDRARPRPAGDGPTSSPCPSLLYAIWYLGWGHTATELRSPSTTSPTARRTSSTDSLEHRLAARAWRRRRLFGGTGGIEWGRPLLVGSWCSAPSGPRSSGGSRTALLLVPLAIGGLVLVPDRRQRGARPAADAVAVPVRRGGVPAADRRGAASAGWRPGWKALAIVRRRDRRCGRGNLSTLHDVYRALRGRTAIVRGGPRRARDRQGRGESEPRADPARTRTSTTSARCDAGPYLSAAGKFGLARLHPGRAGHRARARPGRRRQGPGGRARPGPPAALRDAPPDARRVPDGHPERHGAAGGRAAPGGATSDGAGGRAGDAEPAAVRHRLLPDRRRDASRARRGSPFPRTARRGRGSSRWTRPDR